MYERRAGAMNSMRGIPSEMMLVMVQEKLNKTQKSGSLFLNHIQLYLVILSKIHSHYILHTLTTLITLNPRARSRLELPTNYSV